MRQRGHCDWRGHAQTALFGPRCACLSVRLSSLRVYIHAAVEGLLRGVSDTAALDASCSRCWWGMLGSDGSSIPALFTMIRSACKRHK